MLADLAELCFAYWLPRRVPALAISTTCLCGRPVYVDNLSNYIMSCGLRMRVLTPSQVRTSNLPTVRGHSPPLSTFTMSFGFSPGDVIFVSTATVTFWRFIRDARAEDKLHFLGKLHFLRQLVQRIDECATILSPTLAPLIAESVQGQLSHCLKLLNSLDETAMKYMVVSSSGLRSKRPNLLRRGRWGMDKRDEFLRSLVELEDLTNLLMAYMMFQQLESKVQIPAAPNDTFSSKAFRLIDALDQTIVCDMQLCDTWEVCCILPPSPDINIVRFKGV